MRIQAKNQPSEAHSLAEDSRGMYHDTNKKGGGRHTHFLETAEGGTCQATETKRPSEEHSLPGWRRETCQDTERNQQSEAHSRTGHRRGRHPSGHSKKETKRDTLTSWRRQRQEPVKTQKDIGRARRTHFLETGEAGTC